MPDSLRPRIHALWPDGSPHNPANPQERPRLELYMPPEPAPPHGPLLPAVVVCPGGGYGGRAPHEAAPVAWMFARHGIPAAVCHYRVAPHRYPAPMADVARAMRVMRSLAPQLGIDAGRIALMGFSAGGHAAVTVATRPRLHVDPLDDLAATLSARPNRTILAYPVVSMVDEPHEGCLLNLLGPDAPTELREALSADRWVDERTPPAFLFHTADDPAVPAGHSLRYAAACHAHGVSVEMHLFAHGHHGVGLAQEFPALAPWPRLLLTWLGEGPAAQGARP